MELTVMETPESLEPVSTDPARLERIQRQRDAARKQLQMDADALRHRPFS
ncbi:hypothetical protein [Ralstonia solanacearum]